MAKRKAKATREPVPAEPVPPPEPVPEALPLDGQDDHVFNVSEPERIVEEILRRYRDLARMDRAESAKRRKMRNFQIPSDPDTRDPLWFRYDIGRLILNYVQQCAHEGDTYGQNLMENLSERLNERELTAARLYEYANFSCLDAQKARSLIREKKIWREVVKACHGQYNRWRKGLKDDDPWAK
jgi:hypothetical protein